MPRPRRAVRHAALRDQRGSPARERPSAAGSSRAGVAARRGAGAGVAEGESHPRDPRDPQRGGPRVRHVRRDRARRRAARRRATRADLGERREQVGAADPARGRSGRAHHARQRARAAARRGGGRRSRGARARADAPAPAARGPRRAVRALATTAHRSGTPSSRTRPASRSTTPSSSDARRFGAGASSSSGCTSISRARPTDPALLGGADRELRRPRRRAVRGLGRVGPAARSTSGAAGRRRRPGGSAPKAGRRRSRPLDAARVRQRGRDARSQRRSRVAGSRVPEPSWRPSRVARSTPTRACTSRP